MCYFVYIFIEIQSSPTMLQGLIDNKPPLVNMTDCVWIGDKPFSLQMTAHFIDTYIRFLTFMCRDHCLGPAVLILIKSWKLSHLCLSICWIVYEKYVNWSATRFYITCINRIWLSHAIQRPCILNIIHISYGFCIQIAVWQHQSNGSYKDFNVFLFSICINPTWPPLYTCVSSWRQL